MSKHGADGTAVVAKYKVGDSVTISSTGYDSGPRSIVSVVKVGKRDMALSDGTKCRIDVSNVASTQPGDAEAICESRFRSDLGGFNARAIDSEAIGAMGPAFAAWNRRSERRKARLTAALRVALMTGPASRSELDTRIRALVGRYRGELDHALSAVGAKEAPGSRQHGRIYERAATREDRVDAVVLRVAAAGCEFDVLLAAVAAEVTEPGAEPLQKEVIDSAERCGRVPLFASSFVVLQDWEGAPR